VKLSIGSSSAHDACIILCAVYIVISYRKLVWKKHIYDFYVIVLSVFWHKPYINCCSCSCVLHILLTVLMTADCAGVCLSDSSLEDLDALICLLQRSSTMVCWCHIGKRCIDEHMSTESDSAWQNIWPLSCKWTLPLNRCMLQRTDSIHSNSTEWWATFVDHWHENACGTSRKLRALRVGTFNSCHYNDIAEYAVCFPRNIIVHGAHSTPHFVIPFPLTHLLLTVFLLLLPPLYFCPSWPSYVHHCHH